VPPVTVRRLLFLLIFDDYFLVRPLVVDGLDWSSSLPGVSNVTGSIQDPAPPADPIFRASQRRVERDSRIGALERLYDYVLVPPDVMVVGMCFAQAPIRLSCL